MSPNYITKIFRKWALSLNEGEFKKTVTIFILLLLLIIALLIRIIYLGNTFQTSDNAELAVKIISKPGFSWMLWENYGLIINLIVKSFVIFASYLGITITEFWWKFPIAFIGSLQALLTYFFLRWVGTTNLGSLIGAAILTILPIHVMQSRYLWGYEVLGIFFVTIALWALLYFFSKPNILTGLLVSFFIGLYLLSHGYFLPFAACLFFAILLFAKYDTSKIRCKPYILIIAVLFIASSFVVNRHLLGRIFAPDGSFSPHGDVAQIILIFQMILFFLGMYLLPSNNLLSHFPQKIEAIILRTDLLIFNFVWLFPVLFIPLYFSPIKHAFNKQTRFGFYLFDHLHGFVNNIGIFLLFLILSSTIIFLFNKNFRNKLNLFFLLCGIAYLVPIFVGTPPGITVVRGYLLMGIYFLILFSVLIVEKLINIQPVIVIPLMITLILVTMWGTIDTIFMREKYFDPTFILNERGSIPPDAGSKTAGYLIRKYLDPSEEVLAIHRNIEPPNLYYYFGREKYSHYDLALEDTYPIYSDMKDNVNVVILEESQISFIESNSDFQRRIVVYSENYPRMYIYAKSAVELPILNADVEEYNVLFDDEFSWEIR